MKRMQFRFAMKPITELFDCGRNRFQSRVDFVLPACVCWQKNYFSEDVS